MGNRSFFDDDSIFEESAYYFEKGLRKVKPYFYTYDTFCKERWLGKTLREIYSKEFRLYPIECYERAAKAQNLLLNLKPVPSLDTVVKSNDLISTKLHRHEGPVTAAPIEILADDSKYLVVNKPSGLPIHPCSRYRDNSLLFILAKEFDKKNIHVCHRIDLLTSGVCIFAKTKDVAKTLTKQISERQVEKEYICKVTGVFPDKGEAGYLCEAPITNINPKLGYVCAWKVEGKKSKSAETVFHLMSTDGETSVVRCRPKTGRTHQIRAHLQLLGHPILNDPIYNHEAWGESRFKPGPCDVSLDAVVDRILTEWKEGTGKPHSVKANCAGRDFDFFPDCPECVSPLPDPEPEKLVMYLHARSYKGDKWMFETPLPEWSVYPQQEAKKNPT